MRSKYVDTTSIIQVIGSVFNEPAILDMSDKYTITEDDFPDEFHKITFGAIYKIHELGADKITLESISDFLQSRPKAKAIFDQYKGEEWLLEIKGKAVISAFDYYYGRLKKFTLLRQLDEHGIDVSFIYDADNILDTKKKQAQEESLDNSTLDTLIQKVTDVIEELKYKYVQGEFDEPVQAASGIYELIDELKLHPEVGVPLYGNLINTVTRGARLKKFYLRSAATGVGKSRSMIADVCYIGCSMIYDEQFGWIRNGRAEPVLFITTEQELNEVQTMMLAFLSNVNEEHILNGRYAEGEEERVRKAAEILRESPIYVEEMPDFSLQDIENRIKKGIRDYNVKYVFLDYLHTSIKILEEITRRSGGVKLREDNILFMIAIKLKDICNQYGVFIMSATQLNASYQDSETPDQNLLRGAKSIADKIDMGAILLGVKDEDLVKLEKIIGTGSFQPPNIKISIYKNRRGQWKGIYLWCKADLGTCRINPMFCTGYDYELKSIENMKILIDEESAF